MASEWAREKLSAEALRRGSLDEHDMAEVLDDAVRVGLRAGLQTGATVAEAGKSEAQGHEAKMVAAGIALALMSARGLADTDGAAGTLVDALAASGDLDGE